MADLTGMQKNKFRISGIISLALILLVISAFPQTFAVDPGKMQGTRFSYPITDKSDSLSATEIIELQDERGIPVWFGRYFHKAVCLTGECRMVHMWLYWDGAGNYLGFQPDEKEPLTKTDHHVFGPEDYLKLHRILSDSLSVLKSLKQEELIILPEKKNDPVKVDAYSGATKVNLQEYLVKNAAYTCYTLWHTVYGPTRGKILDLLDARTDSAALEKIFAMNNPGYQVWAIKTVEKHPAFHPAFYPRIIQLIKSGNIDIAHRALDYFTPARLSDEKVQTGIAGTLDEALPQLKFHIILKFKPLPQISNEAILIMLEQYEKQKIYAGLLAFVCELIKPYNLKDARIIRKLNKLSKDKNQYVRSISENLIARSKK